MNDMDKPGIAKTGFNSTDANGADAERAVSTSTGAAEADIRRLCDTILAADADTASGGEYPRYGIDTVMTLLPWLAAPDGELRDQLVYGSLCVVVDNGDFSRDDLERVLDACLSDRYLFRGIGETGTDTVFCRTFSLLAIDLVLDYQSRHPLLPKRRLHRIWDSYLTYVQQERDLRGYVDDDGHGHGNGWAHSLAHGSDVAYSLISLGVPDRNDVLQLFDAWRSALNQGALVYVDEEGERILRAILNLLDHRIMDEHDLVAFVRSFHDLPVSEDYPRGAHAGENVKNFLMCFLCHAKERHLEQLETAIFDALTDWKRRRHKWY